MTYRLSVNAGPEAQCALSCSLVFADLDSARTCASMILSNEADRWDRESAQEAALRALARCCEVISPGGDRLALSGVLTLDVTQDGLAQFHDSSRLDGAYELAVSLGLAEEEFRAEAHDAHGSNWREFVWACERVADAREGALTDWIDALTAERDVLREILAGIRESVERAS